MVASAGVVDTVTLLKALAEETRLRIVVLLHTAEDLCACELEAILALNQSNASRHLDRLRRAGVIEAEKRGLWVHYRLSADGWKRNAFLEGIVTAAVRDLPICSADRARLTDYQRSGYSCATISEWRPVRLLPSTVDKTPRPSI